MSDGVRSCINASSTLSLMPGWGGLGGGGGREDVYVYAGLQGLSRKESKEGGRS